MPQPLSITQPPGEFAHMVEDRVNVGYDIRAIDPHDRSLGRTKRHMNRGTPFSNIDLLPAEHRVAPRRDTALFRKPQQKP